MYVKFYPLQFYPILKERIWGGTKLRDVLQKPITSDFTGESWEISTVPGDVSVVSNGKWIGKNLNEIIDLYPEQILGKSVMQRFGKEFPLLFKFLDARDDLSIQVHPNDALALQRHNSFGKTEMWYVMQADPEAKLIVGFKNDSSSEAYQNHLSQNTVLDLLEQHPVKQGDVFFLETGTVHAIGAGNLIAEIQQTSDITYRIYDFNRKDVHGNARELHTELALDAINYKRTKSRTTYTSEKNTSNTIIECPFFNTSVIPLEGKLSLHRTRQSFTVLMCVEGSFDLLCEGNTYHYNCGETLLLPAILEEYQLEGKARILEIWVS